jgi:hypothetical protein
MTEIPATKKTSTGWLPAPLTSANPANIGGGGRVECAANG